MSRQFIFPNFEKRSLSVTPSHRHRVDTLENQGVFNTLNYLGTPHLNPGKTHLKNTLENLSGEMDLEQKTF